MEFFDNPDLLNEDYLDEDIGDWECFCGDEAPYYSESLQCLVCASCGGRLEDIETFI